jgi:dolichol-phosphate mannosyltransferase
MNNSIDKKLLSIVVPCFNEEENVGEIYSRFTKITKDLERYAFEFLFIDNASIDNTAEILRQLAKADSRVKVILNTRNFGHIRSPTWGLLQSRGSASVLISADMQEPPEYIVDLINKWEMGWKVVLGIKPKSNTNLLVHFGRKIYYRLVQKIANVSLINDANGFGIYDRVVLDKLIEINDPYPYFRGLICELGYPTTTIPFIQDVRKHGKSNNNFYTLFDNAMLGIISYSLVPIRITSIAGYLIAGFSFIFGFTFLILKLIYWSSFTMGLAPLIIGMFFLFGLLFISIGILGEYIGSIQTYVKNRPLVIEMERINFEDLK